MTHDLQKPVHLATSAGKQFDSADTTISGSDGQGTTDIWLKFWLDAADLTHPLTQQINVGKLRVKASEGVPNLGNSAYRNFTTDQW